MGINQTGEVKMLIFKKSISIDDVLKKINPIKLFLERDLIIVKNRIKEIDVKDAYLIDKNREDINKLNKFLNRRLSLIRAILNNGEKKIAENDYAIIRNMEQDYEEQNRALENKKNIFEESEKLLSKAGEQIAAISIPRAKLVKKYNELLIFVNQISSSREMSDFNEELEDFRQDVFSKFKRLSINLLRNYEEEANKLNKKNRKKAELEKNLKQFVVEQRAMIIVVATLLQKIEKRAKELEEQKIVKDKFEEKPINELKKYLEDFEKMLKRASALVDSLKED
jgi:hypothetical protein